MIQVLLAERRIGLLRNPRICELPRQEEKSMKEMNRREFVKNIAIGGTVLGLGGIVFHKPLEALASGKYDIGQCKSVRIKCISE